MRHSKGNNYLKGWLEDTIIMQRKYGQGEVKTHSKILMSNWSLQGEMANGIKSVFENIGWEFSKSDKKKKIRLQI